MDKVPTKRPTKRPALDGLRLREYYFYVLAIAFFALAALAPAVPRLQVADGGGLLWFFGSLATVLGGLIGIAREVVKSRQQKEELAPKSKMLPVGQLDGDRAQRQATALECAHAFLNRMEDLFQLAQSQRKGHVHMEDVRESRDDLVRMWNQLRDMTLYLPQPLSGALRSLWSLAMGEDDGYYFALSPEGAHGRKMYEAFSDCRDIVASLVAQSDPGPHGK